MSRTQRTTAQVLTDTLKANIYCVSGTHQLKSRNNAEFIGYSIIRNDNNTDDALLVRKNCSFEEIIIMNLFTSFVAAEIVRAQLRPEDVGQSPVKV